MSSAPFFIEDKHVTIIIKVIKKVITTGRRANSYFIASFYKVKAQNYRCT